jgi:hypothetical protein
MRQVGSQIRLQGSDFERHYSFLGTMPREGLQLVHSCQQQQRGQDLRHSEAHFEQVRDYSN